LKQEKLFAKKKKCKEKENRNDLRMQKSGAKNQMNWKAVFIEQVRR
jgi:hypothetical protein